MTISPQGHPLTCQFPTCFSFGQQFEDKQERMEAEKHGNFLHPFGDACKCVCVCVCVFVAPVLLPIWVLACYEKPREFSFSSDPSRRASPREVGAARSARALRRAMAEVRFGGKRGVCVVVRIQGLGLEVYCMAQGRCCPALN